MSATRNKKLRWVKGRLASGPYKGQFWAAQLDAAFLMVVPGHPLGQYEVWFADMVLGEKPTVREAQAFAEATLRGYMDRMARGLCKLLGPAGYPG
jgi:hypothetical protein